MYRSDHTDNSVFCCTTMRIIFFMDNVLPDGCNSREAIQKERRKVKVYCLTAVIPVRQYKMDVGM